MSTWKDGATIFDELDRTEGRDLNERVAVEVLGHVWMHWPAPHAMNHLTEPDAMESNIQVGWRPGKLANTKGHIVEPYSGAMESAWLVIEHMVAQGWKCSLNTALYAASPGSYADCLFQKWLPDPEHRGQVRVMLEGDDHANAMPLAICRAALRAVEAERLDAGESRD